MGYHRKSLFYSHYNTMLPIFIKALYHPPFLNLHQGLISKQSKQIQEKSEIKEIMVANSEMKHKFETMLEVIRGLVLLYLTTLWQSTLYILLQHRVQH